MKNENNLKMKEWHHLFIQEYVKNGGNGRAAYMSVRPNSKDTSARAGACALLKYDNVQKEIKNMQDELIKNAKCDVNKRMEVLAEIIMTGTEANKIKAIDLMNKMEGIGVSTTTQNINIGSGVDFSGMSSEDLLKIINSEDDEDDD